MTTRGPFAARRHVVLVGAGHANLLVVRDARRLVARGIRVTLVDPDSFWYSGMAAAVVGGAVHPGRDRVDPRPLARSRGVAVRTGRVVGLDTATGRVQLDDGADLDASAVVLNVGSEVDPHGLPVDRPGITPVKPTSGLITLRDALALGPPGQHVVVVGGGASAIEVSGNLSAGPLAEAAAPRVTLVAAGELVPVVDDEVRARLVAPLLARDVVRVDDRVADIDPVPGGGLVVTTAGGARLEADHVVLATGLRAASVVVALGLGDDRGMPTTATLQHPDHPWVLGAGDAIRFDGDGLPRLGVFAVRQAPVLVDNLLALHGHGELRPYEPQSSWLSAVDLGGGRAVLLWRGWTVTGRQALVLKRLLDEWFLRRHRVPLGASGRGWGRSLARVVEP